MISYPSPARELPNGAGDVPAGPRARTRRLPAGWRSVHAVRKGVTRARITYPGVRVIIGTMRRILLALLAFLLVGCGSSVPSASPALSEPPTATPEPPAGQSDEEIRQAMQQRRDFGLRADEAWVRSVAGDPNASSELLGIPLTKAEALEFQGRQDRLMGVAGLAQRYADDHPGDFAGLYIDQQHKLVVILFTANVDTHAAELAKLIPGDGEPLAVRLAAMSKADLQALVERIVADRDWLRTIDATFVAGGVDEAANRIDLEISSANPDAARLIAEHYGVAPGLLNVTSDGTGIQLLPRGKVRGRVVNADGTPAASDGSLDVGWSPDHEGAGTGECGSEVGLGVGEGGRFVLPCAPGGWTITITDEATHREVGHAHVVVPSGLAVDVVIRLDR